MSILRTENALAEVGFEGFGGIDLRAPEGEGKSARKSKNYKILADGSLKKRSGFRSLFSFDAPVRATLMGAPSERGEGYILAGDSLYFVSCKSGEKRLLGRVGSAEGRASIFYYMNRLYIADGSDYYILGEGGLSSVYGYVPLFGKDWPSTNPGEQNEELNMLSNRVRISYVVTNESSIFLSTLYNAASIDAVYLNDVLLDQTQYSYDRRLKTIVVSGMSLGDRVLAYLTFDLEDRRDEVTENPEVTVFGGISNSRVFAFGGARKNLIFNTLFVSEEGERASRLVYGDCGTLYFPRGYEFIVGDGRYDIRAVSRHFDRLLIFTEGETWMADSSACGLEEFPLMRINTGSGCLPLGGAAKIGNDPVSVEFGRIMRWTAETDTLEDRNCYCISDGIVDMLSESFFLSATLFEHKPSRELLLCATEDNERGEVFILGEGNKWYTYEGVCADGFFDGGEDIGFFKGGDIFIFDEALCEDILPSGERRAICSEYLTNMLSFSHRYRKKRLMGVGLCAESGGEEIRVSLLSDLGGSAEVSFGRGNAVPASFGRRADCGRFFYLAAGISSEARAPQRIYSMSLAVKK